MAITTPPLSNTSGPGGSVPPTAPSGGSSQTTADRVIERTIEAPDATAPTQCRTVGAGVSDHLTDDDVIDQPIGQPNRDPITGARGAHPFGVGVGAATAGVVGGVIGSAVPLVGTAIGVAVGTAVGAVIGGIAGKGAAETLFPTEEEAYWRENFVDRPYYDSGGSFTFDQDYLAAYRFGYINSYAYGTLTFEEVEPQLHQAWDDSRDSSRLDWEQAREAARDAWYRARANQAAADRVPST